MSGVGVGRVLFSMHFPRFAPRRLDYPPTPSSPAASAPRPSETPENSPEPGNRPSATRPGLQYRSRGGKLVRFHISACRHVLMTMRNHYHGSAQAARERQVLGRG